MATKKTAEPRKLARWECPKCKSTFHPVQMELQPKTCTSCGKAELKPVYE